MSKKSLTPMFSMKDIDKAFERFGQSAGDKMYDIMVQTGENAVRIARSKTQEESFVDQTGNLRSSIGYVISRRGEIFMSDFQDSPRGTDKKTGKKQGYDLALELADKFKMNGWVLILVAGMEYAAAVQDIEGKDVLAGTVVETETYLSSLIKGFKNRLYG